MRFSKILAIFCGLLFLAFIQSASSAHRVFAAPPSPDTGVVVGKPVSAFSFDGDVRRLPQHAPVLAPQTTPRLVPRNSLTARASLSLNVTPQKQIPVRSTALPLAQFDGLTATNWTPPSPNGDVNENYFVQVVNTQVGIFDKTGAVLASFTFNSLFSNLASSPCATSNRGDVLGLYDAVSQRWIIADMAFTSSSAPYECIAVSKSSNPLNDWWLYALPVADKPGDPSNLVQDFAKLGIWNDAIYMSANMYASVFQNARVWALNREDLINGLPLRRVFFDVPAQYSSLLPGTARGGAYLPMPSAGTPEFFAAMSWGGDFLHLWKFTLDPTWDQTANASTLSAPIDLSVNPFAMPCMASGTFACVPELNGESVDAVGDRLSMHLQYSKVNSIESLWVNHTIATNNLVGSPTWIRWYEIRDPNNTPTIYQWGDWNPDSNYRWMGSLALDKFGDLALGYSVSSSAMFPDIRYTGRLISDSLNTLQAETTLVQGGGSQLNGGNRWGDYSSMRVDPSDGCTFWYTNEYYSTTGSAWRTRIGSFKIDPTCPTPRTLYLPLVQR